VARHLQVESFCTIRGKSWQLRWAPDTAYRSSLSEIEASQRHDVKYGHKSIKQTKKKRKEKKERGSKRHVVRTVGFLRRMALVSSSSSSG
jgi:hypothetical protein